MVHIELYVSLAGPPENLCTHLLPLHFSLQHAHLHQHLPEPARLLSQPSPPGHEAGHRGDPIPVRGRGRLLLCVFQSVRA